jgi:hypothetical protein
MTSSEELPPRYQGIRVLPARVPQCVEDVLDGKLRAIRDTHASIGGNLPGFQPAQQEAEVPQVGDLVDRPAVLHILLILVADRVEELASLRPRGVAREFHLTMGRPSPAFF